jgi:hypothetical protein
MAVWVVTAAAVDAPADQMPNKVINVANGQPNLIEHRVQHGDLGYSSAGVQRLRDLVEVVSHRCQVRPSSPNPDERFPINQ